MMKRIFKAAVAAVGFTALATSAMAEWTPPGPIKLMIAFAAGGGADTQARMIAEELENKLGWKFIPEQVTGKGGMNLAMAMKDQPNDGTVIGMAVTETLDDGVSILHYAGTIESPDYPKIKGTVRGARLWVGP